MSDNGQANETDTSARPKRLWLRVLKVVVTLLVVAAVAWRCRKIVSAEELRSISVSPIWVVLAGLVYLVGWLPSVWFWNALLRASGSCVPLETVAGGYFIGHLGKYVPGKALVPVLRAGAVSRAGGQFGTAVVAVLAETLYFMGVGLLVAAALLWRRLALRIGLPAGWWTDAVWFGPLVAVVLLIATSPAIAALLRIVVRKLSPAAEGEAAAVPITTPLLLGGAAAMACGWVCLGGSLWATLRALGPVPTSLPLLLDITGSVAVATAVGFLAVITPGGLGVREGLLVETLQGHPELDAAQVVIAAVLLRLVWLGAEVAIAAVFWWRMRTPAARED